MIRDLTRRDFLAASGLAAAATLVGAPAPSA
jgi:hypothetical protein